MKIEISEKRWVVVSDSGHLQCEPKYKRTDAINDAVGGSAKNWSWWKRHYGFRAIRVYVTITEVTGL